MNKARSAVDTRIIYCGDCLDQLPRLPDNAIELAYIDPPFNSNQNYEVFWGETKEKRAFVDRHASTQAYIHFMRPRCVQLHRVLKDTGNFFYHCDWHASHYVKVMLDQIFGENSFLNEIIWSYGGRGAKHVANQFPRYHDVILWYAKGKTHTYQQQRFERQYTLAEARKAGFRQEPESDGRWFKTAPRGDYTDESVKQLRKEGRIHVTRNDKIRIKYHLRTRSGLVIEDTLLGDVWDDIPDAMHMPKERRTGYPTQKHPALMERIIQAASNPGDIVLDAFCGCGTTVIAAEQLKRQWIGIDISPTACRVMAKDIRKFCGLPEDEALWRDGRGFVVRDLPWMPEMLRKIPPFEFENWAVIAIGGLPNKAKVGDMVLTAKSSRFPPRLHGAEPTQASLTSWTYGIRFRSSSAIKLVGPT
jgi:DNA modification methylase